MRHAMKGRKLGTDMKHTAAMKRSLVKALFLNDRIKTIESRAKEIRPDVDRIITWAKKGDLYSRRLAIAALGGDSDLVAEIFSKVEQGMFRGRNGGYTRIMKLGVRKGDNAPMVIMELVMEPVAKKDAAKTDTKKATPRRVSRKAEEAQTETQVEAAEAEGKAEEAIEAVAEPVEAEAEQADAEAVAEVAQEEAVSLKDAAEAIKENAESVIEQAAADINAVPAPELHEEK